MQKISWMMAAVLLGGCTVVMGAQTSATVKDDLFVGTEKFAQNASSVTEVDMDPNSLDMVNGHNASRARRTVLSVVHTYTYEKPGMYNMADVEAFRNKLNTGDWHCSVHTREMKTGESTDVCQKHRTDDLLESAIITVEPRELTFIHTIRRPAPPTTPGTPNTPGRPGGTPEAFEAPFDLGLPIGLPMVNGIPAQAWGAEMRAQAAEMRALAMADRAEMGMLPGMRLDLYGGGFQIYSMPRVDVEGMKDLQTLKLQLRTIPRYEFREIPRTEKPKEPKEPKAPKEPKEPKEPIAPAAPGPESAVPAAPQGVSGRQSLPAPPLPPTRV